MPESSDSCERENAHKRLQRNRGYFRNLIVNVGFGISNVYVALDIDEITIADTKITAKTDRCIGSDPSFVVKYALNAGDRYSDVIGKARGRNA